MNNEDNWKIVDNIVPWFEYQKVLYRWHGWFGCQLESFEYKKVEAGTERNMFGRKFRVFRCTRISRNPFARKRYEITWTIGDHGTIDESGARIRKLKQDLKDLV